MILIVRRQGFILWFIKSGGLITPVIVEGGKYTVVGEMGKLVKVLKSQLGVKYYLVSENVWLKGLGHGNITASIMGNMPLY